LDEGSVVDGMGLPTSAYPFLVNEIPTSNPGWTSISKGTYKSYIMSSRTGGKRLSLPLTSQGATPIDVIKRPVPNEDVTKPLVYPQRFYTQAALRILLSDTAPNITNLPGINVGVAPFNLDGDPRYVPAGIMPPFATSGGAAAPGLNPNSYLSAAGQSLLHGFIKIELQNAAGGWQDVTGEILNLGIAGRNLSNGVVNVAGNACPNEPNPNAVIRLQRVRDNPQTAGFTPCGTNVGGNLSPNGTEYWPNAMYDTREGNLRDARAANDATMSLGGAMYYVELDVNNLRRWFAGNIGVSGVNAVNQNGYIVYFSDRRNNFCPGVPSCVVAGETGEYGFEDFVNPGDINGVPNAVLDAGEDVNGNAVLDVYGQTAQQLPLLAAAPLDALALPTTTTILAEQLRVNRPLHFRRALKLVHGGIGDGGAGISGIPTVGFTVASENPVYIQGNWNATAASAQANPHYGTSVLADAVTLLSSSWNDIASFVNPNDPNGRRVTANTSYRVAIASGKGLSFKLPTWAGVARDFGTDGGAHNFLRYLENWTDAGGVQHNLNYTGSIVSLFTSRQGIGTYKCCTNVYSPPVRNYIFDTDFLLPPLLPPGTPMFRDVNTLTFRQLLRPNQ
jgi:hypothetical protein